MAFNPIVIDFIRDDNEALRINDTTENWRIVSIMGLEFPEPEVFTANKGLGDGLFITGRRLNGRTIEIHLRPRVRHLQEVMDQRRRMMSFFDPSHTFLVRFNVYDSGSPADTATRVGQIPEAVLLAASYPVIQAEGAQEDLVLQFLGPDPYFVAPADTLVTFSNLAGGVHKTVTSSATVRSRLTVKLTCTSAGNGQNQIVVNWNDVGIGFGNVDSGSNPINFKVGDVIEIDPETIKVTFNGTDRFSGVYTDPNDVYESWFVNPGANDFYIDLFGKTPTFTVGITYVERYYGV